MNIDRNNQHVNRFFRKRVIPTMEDSRLTVSSTDTHQLTEVQKSGNDVTVTMVTAADNDPKICASDQNNAQSTKALLDPQVGVPKSDNSGTSAMNSESGRREQSGNLRKYLTQNTPAERMLPNLESFGDPVYTGSPSLPRLVDSNNNPSIVDNNASGVRGHVYRITSPGEHSSSATAEMTMRESESVVASLSSDKYNMNGEKDSCDGKKTHRRGSAWTDFETDFLFEVWALHSQSKNGEEFGVHNAPIYRIISKAMADVGYAKSPEQCKTRIHTLKRAYKLTKDETLAGNPSVTYCRHFDKLEVIMGDSASLTPQQLSDSLSEKRSNRVLQASTEKTPNKRSRGHSGSKAKRPSPGNKPRVDGAVSGPDCIIAPTPPKQIAPTPQKSAVQVLPNVNTFSSFWNATNTVSQSTPYPYILSAALQSPALSRNDKVSQPNERVISQTVAAHHVYESPETNSHPGNQQYALPEVNNNTVIVKEEKQTTADYGLYDQSHLHVTQQQQQPETRRIWNQPQPVQTTVISPQLPEVTQKSALKTKEDLERLKLDLEMRKLEMERTKLEMEERQRREEREHQYRMMQLLLHGLGQQNAAAFGAAGQMADTVEAHGADLSRAIENGLVPGGAHGANEKGLSFNEI